MNNYNYKSVILYTIAGLLFGCMVAFNGYLLNVENGFNQPWFHIFDFSPDYIIIISLPAVFALLFCFIGIRWQQLISFNKIIKENLLHEQDLGTMADRHLRMLGKVVAEMNDAVMIIDNNGCILWGNESFSEITGYSIKEALGENAGTILMGPTGEGMLMKNIKMSLVTKNNLIDEMVHYRKNGSKYWAMINVKPIFNDKDKISNYVIIQTDVTARKEREIALEQETLHGHEYPAKSTDNLNECLPVAEMAKTGRWEMDTINNKIFLTQELRKIYCLPLSGEITKEDVFTRIYPDDVHIVEKAIANAIKGEKTEFEYRFLTGNAMLYLVSNLRPKVNTEDQIDGCIGRVFDITHSKKTALALMKSEIERTAVFNNAPTLICLHDINGKILDLNKAALDKIGYSKEELVGKNMSSILLSQYQCKFELYLQELKQNKKAEGTFLVMSKSGKKMAWLYQNTLCENKDEEQYVIATSIDITESLKAKVEIDKQQEFISQIIDNSPNVIFVVDRQQNVVLYNKAFNRFYNCESRQIVSASELAKENDIFLGGLSSLFEMEEGKSISLEGSTSGNDLQENAADWYSVTKKYFRDKKGKKYILVIGMDITSRYQIEKDLIAANEMVESSLKVKDQFISNMSHEIRTPLNAMLGFTDLLSASCLNIEQREYIDIIKAASENLLGLINNILDLSKIDSGQVLIENIAIDIRKVISDVSKILEPRLKGKPVQLNINIDKDIPSHIKGDQLRLSQVLFNLLGNAMKFTDAGFIELNCKKVDGPDERKQYLSFTVSDTGIGVSKDKQKAIFERFTQANDNTERLYGGTGLGLNIAKGIVELYGGTLKMESTPGHGTVFYFIIPFSTCEEDMEITTSNEYPQLNYILPTANTTYKILLVEDNPINAMLATQVLENGGFNVTHAVNGQEGVDKVQQEHFDVLLMDIQMPVMNGITATEKIRALDIPAAKIPIIAMTAHSLYGEIQNCYNAGMNGYVSKPFKSENLYAAIMKALNIQDAEKNEIICGIGEATNYRA